jgi:hypothetical protein
LPTASVYVVSEPAQRLLRFLSFGSSACRAFSASFESAFDASVNSGANRAVWSPRPVISDVIAVRAPPLQADAGISPGVFLIWVDRVVRCSASSARPRAAAAIWSGSTFSE